MPEAQKVSIALCFCEQRGAVFSPWRKLITHDGQGEPWSMAVISISVCRCFPGILLHSISICLTRKVTWWFFWHDLHPWLFVSAGTFFTWTSLLQLQLLLHLRTRRSTRCWRTWRWRWKWKTRSRRRRSPEHHEPDPLGSSLSLDHRHWVLLLTLVDN